MQRRTTPRRGDGPLTAQRLELGDCLVGFHIAYAARRSSRSPGSADPKP